MRRATAALAAAFAACAVLAGACGLPAPSQAPTASASPAAAPTVVPTPAPALTPDVAWARVPGSEVFEDGFADALAASTDRYVAVGTHAGQATAWTSADGRSWQRDGISVRIETLVRVAPDRLSFVAAGPRAWAEDRAAGAAIAVSDDGSAWRSEPDQPSLDGAVVGGLARLGDRLVALGWSGESIRGWTSAEGITWEPVEGLEVPADARYVFSLAASGDRLAALAESEAGGSLVLTSTDGTRWNEIEAPDGFVGVLGVHDGALVAAGTTALGDDARPAVWISADWATWDRAILSTVWTGGVGWLARDAGGYVAMGVGAGAQTGQLGTWWSNDLVAWTRIPSPRLPADGHVSETTGISDLADGPAGVVAVGYEPSDGGRSRVVVWVLHRP